MKTDSLKSKTVKKDNDKGWKKKNYDNTYCDGWCFKSPNGQKDNDNSTFGVVHVPLFTHVPDEIYHSGAIRASVVAPLVMHVVFVQRCYFPLSNNNFAWKDRMMSKMRQKCRTTIKPHSEHRFPAPSSKLDGTPLLGVCSETSVQSCYFPAWC